MIRSLADRFGIRVARAGALNRFDAVEPCLRRMKRMGFDPRIVVDGGAIRGQFYRRTVPIFPDELFDVASLTSRPRDGRLRMGDIVFVRRNTPLVRDVSWA
jgi:hypothetical protein